MKKISIIFFKVIVVIIGISAFAFLLWEPHIEGRNINATPYQIYFNDPFLVYAYIASISFFIILYKIFKVLEYIGQNKAFSQETTKALQTIKYCAIANIGFVAIGEIFIMLNDNDDRAGGVFMGILITLGSVLIAIVSARLERNLQNTVDIKSSKRILIVGSCGAGKSVLADKIHKQFKLPLIHLDQLYWRPNWERTDKENWKKIVGGVIKKDEWIIDGNYRSTLYMRLPKADAVIFLDFPRLLCFWRVLKRRILKNRKDQLNNCKERITLELAKWVLWDFPRNNKKSIYEHLKKLEPHQKFIILKSNYATKNFLKNL